jgi:hypothetical protein
VSIDKKRTKIGNGEREAQTSKGQKNWFGKSEKD